MLAQKCKQRLSCKIAQTQIGLLADAERVARRLGLTAMQAVVALQGGEVAIAPKPPLIAEGALGFGPACLKDGEAAIVAAEVCKLVQAAAAKAGVEVAATAEE